MRPILTLFIIFASLTQLAFAQGQAEITLKGRVSINYKMCSGAKLTLCQLSAASDDCVEVAQLTSPKNGQFEFKLNRDNSYRIKVEKDGFTDRIIEFNTTLPKEPIDPLKLTFEFQVELAHSAEAKEAVTVASVYFNTVKGSFNYRIPSQK